MLLSILLDITINKNITVHYYININIILLYTAILILLYHYINKDITIYCYIFSKNIAIYCSKNHRRSYTYATLHYNLNILSLYPVQFLLFFRNVQKPAVG